jgi:hypothetical protein
VAAIAAFGVGCGGTESAETGGAEMELGGPSITSFTADRSSVSLGKPARLTAVFAGGTGEIDNGVGAVISAAPISTPNLAANTRFTLTVTSPSGVKSSKTVDVATAEAPSITSFGADLITVTSGKGAMLTAVFSGGTGIVDQSVGAVISGTAKSTGNIASDKTFTLTVTNEAGDAVTATTSVAAVAAPAITSFTAAAPTVSRGGATSLTAAFTGGVGAVNHGVGAVVSDAAADTGPINADVTYTLTVTNAAGDTATRDATVTRKKELYVSNYSAGTLAVFDQDATGDLAPKRTIGGSLTTMGSTRGLFVVNDELFMANQSQSLLVFNVTDSGNVAPKRRIAGAATTMGAVAGVFVSGGEIFIGDQSGAMKVWNATDTGDVAPKRVLTGALTGLGQTHYTYVDGGELYVANFSVGTVTVYPATASGNTAPTRTITVPGGNPIGLYILGNELFVSQAGAAVRVFDKSTGALLRLISGASTTLAFTDQCSIFLGELYCAVYDTSRVVVFPSNAMGNVAPTRAIAGSLTTLNQSLGLFIY